MGVGPSVGGVLAQHAASGANTAVVTATWSPDSQRAAELADALKVLGAAEPRMLGYADARIPDSAPGRPRLCDAPIDEVVEMLVGHIRAVRPQLVLTHSRTCRRTSAGGGGIWLGSPGTGGVEGGRGWMVEREARIPRGQALSARHEQRLGQRVPGPEPPGTDGLFAL